MISYFNGSLEDNNRIILVENSSIFLISVLGEKHLLYKGDEKVLNVKLCSCPITGTGFYVIVHSERIIYLSLTGVHEKEMDISNPFIVENGNVINSYHRFSSSFNHTHYEYSIYNGQQILFIPIAQIGKRIVYRDKYNRILTNDIILVPRKEEEDVPIRYYFHENSIILVYIVYARVNRESENIYRIEFWQKGELVNVTVRFNLPFITKEGMILSDDTVTDSIIMKHTIVHRDKRLCILELNRELIKIEEGSSIYPLCMIKRQDIIIRSLLTILFPLRRRMIGRILSYIPQL